MFTCITEKQDTVEENKGGWGAGNSLFSSQSFHHIPGSGKSRNYLPDHYPGQAITALHLED